MASIQDKIDEEFLENYEVAEERAAFIRNHIKELRELQVMENLKDLAKELGSELVEGDENGAVALPGFAAKGESPLVFAAPEGHAADGLRIALQNTDLKVFKKEKMILELSFLPKDNDFVVFFLDEEELANLKGWMDSLKDFTDAAKAKKKERKAKWAKRFKKKK